MKTIILILFGFLVTWNVSNHYPASCCKGEPAFLEDEYGREYQNPCFTYAIACWETVVTEKSREFETESAAIEFVEKTKNQLQTGYPASTLSDFQILTDEAM